MKQKILLVLCTIVMFVAGFLGASLALYNRPVHVQASSSGDWPTFMGNGERTGYNPGETIINASNASNLHLAWTFTTGNMILASPTIVNNVMYIGSWDGYEYAIDLATHQQIWKTYLGITKATTKCYIIGDIGVTSTAAVQNNVVYVGGGDGNMYALNALDGAVIWKTFLAAPPYYNWSSPLLYNNELYIGLAAYCDPPFVQGKVKALNVSDGSIAASISLVPDGQTGAPVWSSLAVDTNANRLYVTTGNPGSQSYAKQPLSSAILALDPGSLKVLDQFQLPVADQTNDDDFGASPMLFDVNGVSYVGVLNKNGLYFVLNRSNLAGGYVWVQNLAGLPLQQSNNDSTSCYHDGVLYTGSGVVRGTKYGGSVHAFDAVTGQQIWAQNTLGRMEASIMCTKDLLVDAAGNAVQVRDASNGNILYHYVTSKPIHSTPVISNGVLYAASDDGSIYAFSLKNMPTPTPSTTPGGTLAQDTFRRANQTFWGTASDGQTWGGDANTVPVFSIAGNTGQVANGDNSYDAVLGPSATDAEAELSGASDHFGGSNTIGAVLRWTDAKNMYRAYIDGSNLVIQKRTSGINVTLGSVAFTATAGTSYTLLFSAVGTTLSAKVWQTGNAEPPNWMVTAVDTGFTSGYCGLRIGLPRGSTATIASFIAIAQ